MALKQSAKIFENQSKITIDRINDIEIKEEKIQDGEKYIEYTTHSRVVNMSSCESLKFQTNGDGNYSLKCYGRLSPKFPYEQIDIITDSFDIVQSVNKNGGYSIGIGGVGSIEFRLESIDPNTKLNCYANLF